MKSPVWWTGGSGGAGVVPFSSTGWGEVRFQPRRCRILNNPFCGLVGFASTGQGSYLPQHLLNLLPLPQMQLRFLLGRVPSVSAGMPGLKPISISWSISGSGFHGSFVY